MYRELLLLYLVWGCNWSVMRVSNDFFSPLSCAMWRFTVGAAVLALVIAFLKKPLPKRRFWPWIALVGTLQIAYNNVAIQLSISELGAGVAAVINYCMPLWMAVLAHFCLGEKLVARKLLGIVTSILGIAMLTGFQIDTSLGLTPLLWCLSSSVVWAVSGIIVKTKLKGCDLLSMTTWQMIFGVLALMLVCQVFPQQPTLWTTKSILLLAYNGILASALAFLLWMRILSGMEAAKAGAFVLMVPVVGVLSGVIFLNESLSFAGIIGIVLVLSGILLVQWQRQPSGRISDDC